MKKHISKMPMEVGLDSLERIKDQTFRIYDATTSREKLSKYDLLKLSNKNNELSIRTANTHKMIVNSLEEEYNKALYELIAIVVSCISYLTILVSPYLGVLSLLAVAATVSRKLKSVKEGKTATKALESKEKVDDLTSEVETLLLKNKDLIDSLLRESSDEDLVKKYIDSKQKEEKRKLEVEKRIEEISSLEETSEVTEDKPMTLKMNK